MTDWTPIDTARGNRSFASTACPPRRAAGGAQDEEKPEERKNRRKPQERFLARRTSLGMTAKGKSKKKNKDKTKTKKERARHAVPLRGKNQENIKAVGVADFCFEDLGLDVGTDELQREPKMENGSAAGAIGSLNSTNVLFRGTGFGAKLGHG